MCCREPGNDVYLQGLPQFMSNYYTNCELYEEVRFEALCHPFITASIMGKGNISLADLPAGQKLERYYWTVLKLEEEIPKRAKQKKSNVTSTLFVPDYTFESVLLGLAMGTRDSY